MKKRYLHIILIVVLIGVWGSVIRTLVLARNPPPVSNRNMRERDHNELTVAKAVYVVDGDYRDPFGSTKQGIVSLKPTPTVKRAQSKRSARPEPALSWPRIEFYGYVASATRASQSLMFSIDDQEVTLVEGDAVGQLRLLSVADTMATFTLGDEKKNIGLVDKIDK